MQKHFIKQSITNSIPRDFFLDMEEKISTTFRKALDCVRNDFTLTGSDASWAGSILRFIKIQSDFGLDAKKYGGIDVSKHSIEGLPKGIYQPFHLFENNKMGCNILLGFTSLSVSKEIPKPNLSRQAAIELNKLFTQNPDLFEAKPSTDIILRGKTIYVCLCVVRNKRDISEPEEIALGIIDPFYQNYTHYFPLKEIFASYSDQDTKHNQNEKPMLKIKKNVLPFGENPTQQDKNSPI